MANDLFLLLIVLCDFFLFLKLVFVNLTQARVTWEDGISTEKVSPND